MWYSFVLQVYPASPWHPVRALTLMAPSTEIASWKYSKCSSTLVLVTSVSMPYSDENGQSRGSIVVLCYLWATKNRECKKKRVPLLFTIFLEGSKRLNSTRAGCCLIGLKRKILNFNQNSV